MSMSLMVQAMKTKVGNPLRKLVLIKLADNASDSGECWPSYQHIADHCEIDRSTVRRHIKALEEMGLLHIQNREGPKGNTSNLYVLRLQGAIGTESTGVGTESTAPVGTESTRTSHSFKSVNEPIIDQNKESLEKAFEIFYQAGMRKLNKKAALKSFAKQVKERKVCPTEFANMLADDVRKRVAAQQMGFDAMHPTTYLNNERWEDEIVQRQEQQASPAKQFDNWYASDAGIDRKAKELGITPRATESYKDLKDRIQAHLKAGQLSTYQQDAQTTIYQELNDDDIPY